MRCEECGVAADERALGWRAILPESWDEDDPAVTLVHCPVCAWREFGAPADD